MGLNNKVAPIEKVQVDVENSDKIDKKAECKVQRRSDIDVLRIALTWGILLYHVTLIYAPYAKYYVKIIQDEIPNWHLVAFWFSYSMECWNMPMFFFLSGIRQVNFCGKYFYLYYL